MATIKQNKERISRDIQLKRAMLNKKPKVDVKVVPRWQFPHGAELGYRKQLFKIVSLIEESLTNMLIPRLPILQAELNANRPQLKTDDYLSDLNGIIAGMQVFINKNQNDPKLIASTIGMDISQFNREQMLKIMRRVFGVDVFTHEPWLSDQLDLFATQNVDLIKDLSDKAMGDIKGIVTRGFASGINLKNMTGQLQDRIGFTKNRAKLIARDQTSKLNGQLTQLRQTQNGISKYQWATAGDERVRPSHAEKEGRIFSWDNPPADTGNPGDDINCLIGETKVSSPIYAKKLFRRFYSGKTTKIITSSGEAIVGTPNHPIFTSKGWLPLEKVNIGDDIVCLIQQRSCISKSNDQNTKATFKEIFEFLSILFETNTRNGSTNQFHGDGIINEQVDIIDIDSCLLNNFKIMFDEKACQFIFAEANMALDFLPCNSSINSCLFALGFTSLTAISFFSKLFSLVFGKATHSDAICLRTITKLNTIFCQSKPNTASSNIIFLRQGQDTFTREILFDKLFFIKLLAIWRRSMPTNNIISPIPQNHREIIRMTLQEFGDLTKSQPGLHKLIRIVDKSSSIFSGHVYNLENYYSAYIVPDNMIVGNCRCVGIPILEDLV